MKSLWKSLLLVCALSGVVTLAAAVGCGPQQAFCPNTGSNGGVCPIQGDDHQMQGQDSGGLTCPAGQKPGINPVTEVYECIPD